jgi:hypothetical protein
LPPEVKDLSSTVNAQCLRKADIRHGVARRICLALSCKSEDAMSRKLSAIVSAAVVACAAVQVATPALGRDTLPPDQAPNHVGETATVCGVVASTRYASGRKGQPTFLNLDRSYPHQVFTIVIWGSDRSKFGTPEITLMGKNVCATGTIQTYLGKAEIIAVDPQQLGIRP